jgi:hypothetical protein
MTTFFTHEEGSILLRLLIAHLLTDFFWQPDKWVKEKENRIWSSKFLWYHCILTGIVAWIFLWDTSLWWAALAVMFLHLLTDGVKSTISRNINKNGHYTVEKKAKIGLKLFTIDQLSHILVLIAVWLFIIKGYGRTYVLLKKALPDYRLLLHAAGYLFVLEPVGYFIGWLTRRWSGELNVEDSLHDAGRWIGMLERILILTFVYMGQFAAIGFLITAKSLLRVIDRPDRATTDPGFIQPFSSRKHSEYVLIGTFLSFAIALGTGLIVNYFLGL